MPQDTKRQTVKPQNGAQTEQSEKKSKRYIISQPIVEGMHKAHNRELVS